MIIYHYNCYGSILRRLRRRCQLCHLQWFQCMGYELFHLCKSLRPIAYSNFTTFPNMMQCTCLRREFTIDWWSHNRKFNQDHWWAILDNYDNNNNNNNNSKIIVIISRRANINNNNSNRCQTHDNEFNYKWREWRVSWWKSWWSAPWSSSIIISSRSSIIIIIIIIIILRWLHCHVSNAAHWHLPGLVNSGHPNYVHPDCDPPNIMLKIPIIEKW